MDLQNDDFEKFLRQFQLRESRPVPVMSGIDQERREPIRWMWFGALAAAVAVMVVGIVVRPWSSEEPVGKSVANLAGLSRVPESVSPPSPPSTLDRPDRIETGVTLRPASSPAGDLVLDDGSVVEVKPQSEVSLDKATDGAVIRLDGGSVIVTAAPQRSGHLYVRTRDLTVSVVGTIFVVSVEPAGSRVAVIQGNVEVQQAAGAKTLSVGEQVVSSPVMPLVPIAEEIAWSRSASVHLARLQQPKEPSPENIITVARQAQAPPPSPQPTPPNPVPPVPGPSPTSESDGRAIFERACGLCHDAGLVGNSHFETVSEYAAVVNRMAGMGAPISAQEAALVSQYLFKTYGKGKQVDPGPGKAVVEAACTQCHGLEGLQNRDGADRASFRDLVDRMINYGAPVKSDQVDPLVEYLFRTYGRRPL